MGCFQSPKGADYSWLGVMSEERVMEQRGQAGGKVSSSPTAQIGGQGQERNPANRLEARRAAEMMLCLLLNTLGEGGSLAGCPELGRNEGEIFRQRED